MGVGKLKYKFLAIGAAAIFLSSAYAFWQNEKELLPVVTDKETIQSANPTDGLPNAQSSANQKSGVVVGAGNLKTSDHPPNTLSIPESVEESSRNWPDTVRLWQTAENDSSTIIDGMPATRLQVNPERLSQLHVGQTLSLEIPHEGITFEAKIASTHNDPGGVKVWRADIADGLDEAGVIISQGKIQTHLIIASEQGNYSVVIDNKTGESTLIDEGEINARQAPFDDGIVVGPPDESTLPPIN